MVHKDFNALGPAPYALTRIQEWSEQDQYRADAWEGRKKAKEAEIRAGRYGEIQQEIRKLHERKAALRRKAKLKELETRVREAHNRKGALDRKLHDGLRTLPQAVKTEKEIKELNEKIEAIRRKIRESKEYVKLTEDIRACEKRRGQVDREARESPKLKAMLAKADAAGKEMKKAEERVRQLPEVKKLLELSEKEKDGRKKRELREKYSRLYEARKSSDSAWQKASIASRRLRRLHQEAARQHFESHAGRKKVARQLGQLRKDLGALESRLRKSHPELSGLEKSVAAKHEALNTARRKFEEQYRAKTKDDYKKAEAAITAARKAVDDERKRHDQANANEYAKLDAAIKKLHDESNALRTGALRKARLLGRNPYPGRHATGISNFQRRIVYRTSADWDDRTPEEARNKAPEKMKKWLKRVRGF